MDEGKLIYKYTHAQAVADGELRKIPWKAGIPLYISKDASKLFEKEDDESLAAAAAYALLMAGPITRWQERMGCMHNGVEYELVRGFAIRDDDKKEFICTIVAKGER